VVAGVPGPVYAKVFSLDFAPAGHRYGYEVRTADGQKAVVIDGERGPLFAAAEDIVWSADGRHYAYRVMRAEGNAWAAVRDGVVGDFQPGRISKLALSPTGAHLAVAREDGSGKTRLAFYDGKRIAENATALLSSPFKWSLDGSTFASVAEEAKGATTEKFLVVNGDERGRGSNIDSDYLALSDDGRHFAVNLTLAAGKSFVIHDSHRYGPYKDLWGKPTLSANGAHVAFIATLEDDFAHAVVNGKPGPAASTRHGIKSLKLSADGRVAAYLRQTAEKQWAIHHGERILPDAGEIIQLWLSPDGTHAAWVIRTSAGLQVVVDGKTTEPVYRDISRDNAVFSPDGRNFLYVATRDRESSDVRVAGKGGRTYEVAAPLFQFGVPGVFSFVAFEKGVFYRETWSLRR
ncbi:MAG: PD40 domain-containing protein, partial [Opitutaceae bacterium]|nr:PD40 domain-containing protein [Opitutaceae bacterium]